MTTIAPARVVQGSQVAQLLNLPSARAFFARLRKLRNHGFPPPLPGLGRRWDREAVLRWLDTQGGLAPTLAVSAAEAELIRRAEHRGHP